MFTIHPHRLRTAACPRYLGDGDLKTYIVDSFNLLINRNKLIIYRFLYQIQNEFAMARLMLSDERWSKLKEIMLQHKIYNKPNLRMIVEAMLYRMRVGCPWCDLPIEFGFWHSIYQQFNRWSSKNKLMRIVKDLVQEPDLEWEFIDGSIIKAHQHSSGAIGKDNQSIGKSVAGNTTKIHMAVDAFGFPIEFQLTGGEVHDAKAAPERIAKRPKAIYTIADKG